MATRRLTRLALTALPALALAALLFAALFLAGDAETDASRLGGFPPWLFGGAAVAVLVLLGTIAVALGRLLRQVRARAPGARLASRWTLALVLLAVPPVLLVYGFALRFVTTSIDSWFNVRVAEALDDALALGRIYLDDQRARAGAATEAEARALAILDRGAWSAALDTALDQRGALGLAVFSGNGALLAAAAADPRLLLPAAPEAATLLGVRNGGTDVQVEPLGTDLAVRAVSTVDADAVLVATYPLPAAVQPLARRIESSWHDYQRLAFLRGSLKLTFVLILSAVLLLSLLLAVLAALRVARRQVEPVARLARGTQEIAAGHLGHQLPPAGDDELGFLTDSFNRMSAELADASVREHASQAETERQRAYLQAVLERLSSGVIAYDADGRLRTANTAATEILGLPEARVPETLDALAALRPALAPLAVLLAARAREGVREWREELRLAGTDGDQVLVLRAAELPGAAGPGAAGVGARYVVVFDDQTVLNQAQREAAWGEVARRLAHEVKNPLTPIQLAAERMEYKLAPRLEGEDRALLGKATQTIVAQVEALKAMVNAFGDYARPPQLRLEPLALNALVAAVLDLYDQSLPLPVARALDPAEPRVRADAVRMRQLLHNLVKNALEASAGEPVIEVATRIAAGEVEIVVSDRGAGLPPDFDARWFEPYRSGKSRGSGLGLAIVRKVAEEHGGNVRAERRDGGGARFVVTLPLA